MRKSSLQRRLLPALLVTFVAAASLLVAAGADAAPDRAHPSPSANLHPDVLTPLIASIHFPPHPVRAADGRVHVAYELQLNNPIPAVATIEKVETLDPASDEVLQTIEGDAVAALMVHLGDPATGASLSPGAFAFIVMDASFATRSDIPRRLVHEFTVSFLPDAPGVPHTARTGMTKIVRDQPVVIGPPLRGARWVDVNGCCAQLTSHRGAFNPVNGGLFLAQRYAIDFLQLDADGLLFVGPPEQLSSFPFYGSDVLAVADGVVVGTRDGLPDNTPVGSLPPDLTVATAFGNHVILDIGGGRFAGYAHLRPGSLRVAVGDHVATGQVLGRLGNSGNSSAPHLHFQITDGPSPLGSEGLPYEFRFFGSEGTLANGEDVLAGGPAVIDPALSGPHSRQLPLDLQVINFRTRRGAQ